MFLRLGLPCSQAADGWEGQIFSLTWDNDAVALTDRHYTQGARIAWWSRDDHLGCLKTLSGFIPAFGINVQAQKWGLAVGQDIYTPENLRASQLIVEDRPYAGWLFGSFGWQRRGTTGSRWHARETLRIDLGIVGPESLADDTQKYWHGVAPEGWEHQLRTEIGAVLRYDRQYQFSMRSADQFWGFDFLPHLGAGAGNVETYLVLGPTVRLGINLPDEFASARENPTPPRWGAYLFTGVDGRLVLHNIFLDGNTFVESHHVQKEPFAGEWKSGLTLVLKNVELTAAWTMLTREFETQETRDSYGTATVTIKF